MSILWCGGEDIDFPNGMSVIITGNSSYFRSGYARCAISCNALNETAQSRGTVFPAGPVTSAWLSFRIIFNGGGSSNARLACGLGKSGTSSGLFVGVVSSTNLGIYTYDGSTFTLLQSLPAAFPLSGLIRIDLQVSNFGSSGTVSVYVNGAFAASFSGNIAPSNIINFDSVVVGGTSNNYMWISEIVVGDEDTRSMSLATLAPTGPGNTDAWSGSVISGSTLGAITESDTAPVFSNVASQDEQAVLTTPTAGTWGVKAVKIAARAAASTDAAITKVQLGVKQGGTVGVAAAHALGNSYTTVEDILPTNPSTSTAWQYSDLSAIQLDLRTSA